MWEFSGKIVDFSWRMRDAQQMLLFSGSFQGEPKLWGPVWVAVDLASPSHLGLGMDA